MMARLRTMTRQWLFPVLGALALVGTVMGDATDSPFDIVENQYQDGFKGATGDLSFDARREPARTLFFITVDRTGLREMKPEEILGPGAGGS